VEESQSAHAAALATAQDEGRAAVAATEADAVEAASRLQAEHAAQIEASGVGQSEAAQALSQAQEVHTEELSALRSAHVDELEQRAAALGHAEQADAVARLELKTAVASCEEAAAAAKLVGVQRDEAQAELRAVRGELAQAKESASVELEAAAAALQSEVAVAAEAAEGAASVLAASQGQVVALEAQASAAGDAQLQVDEMRDSNAQLLAQVDGMQAQVRKRVPRIYTGPCSYFVRYVNSI
jgi:hypothetical protein